MLRAIRYPFAVALSSEADTGSREENPL